MTYTPDPAATYTTNYTLEKPSHGSHDGTWEQWIASAFDTIDAAIAAAAASGPGDTVGPASATDNAIARFDSTTGKLLQNSGATLSDTGVLNLPAGGGVTVDGVALETGSSDYWEGSATAGEALGNRCWIRYNAATGQWFSAHSDTVANCSGLIGRSTASYETGATVTHVQIRGAITIDNSEAGNAIGPDWYLKSSQQPGLTPVKPAIARLIGHLIAGSYGASNTYTINIDPSPAPEVLPAIDALAAPTDITTLNATTAAHGLCPKGDANTAHYLRGDLTWGTPVGGTGAVLDEYGRLPQAEIGTQIGAVDPTTTDGDLIYRKKTTISTYVIGAIGDSITIGQVVSAGADPVSHLVSTLSTSDLAVTASNQAIGGTTTEDWLPTGSHYPTAVAAFAAAGVSAVVVMLGTNDSYTVAPVSADTYYSNLKIIVSDLVGRGYIVFLAYPTYSSATLYPAATIQSYIPQIDRLENNQTVFIVGRQDYAYFAANTSLLQGDGVHPTDAGSILLGAHLWAPEIAPIIAQRTGITTLQRLTLGTNLSITNGVINAAGGTVTGGASRLAAIAKSVAIATTDAATGKMDSVDLTCSYGQISRIRVRADWTAGQQSGAGTFQVNNSAGITAAATTIAVDTLSAGVTLAEGDLYWVDNECIRCGASTTSSSTTNLTRGYAGTIATIHQDNAVCYKANDGLTLDLYPSSARVPAERLLRLSGIMTESLTTNAAISAGDHVLKFSVSPIVVSDVGRGSLFRVIDTTSDLVRVQDAYGAVSESGISAFANSITTYDALTAHDSAKNVQRVIEYDLPLLFKFPTGTILYLTLTPAEKISATVNVTIEFIVDQFGA